MKIKLEKQSDHYRADCLDMPGSPPVGLGKTKEMAIAHLFYCLTFRKPGPHNTGSWIEFIDKDRPIILIDEEKEITWSYPESYKNL